MKTARTIISGSDTCSASTLRYIIPPNGWGTFSDNTAVANSASYWNATTTSRAYNFLLMSSTDPSLGAAGAAVGLGSLVFNNGPGASTAIRGYTYQYSQQQIVSNNNYGGDFRLYVRASNGSSPGGAPTGFSSLVILDANATGTFTNVFSGVVQSQIMQTTPVNIVNLENLRTSLLIAGNSNITIGTARRISVLNGISPGAVVRCKRY